MIKLKDILINQEQLAESQKQLNYNAKKLLEEKNNDILTEAEYAWLDKIQLILDYAGIIPIIGDIIDVVNAIVYFFRGKWLDGTLSIIAMIPVVGSLIALPFKTLFKLLGPVMVKLGSKLSKLIAKGSGKECAQLFIETCIKNVPDKQLYNVIEVVNKNIDKISDVMKPITKKFDALHNFNHMLVPDAIESSIRSLGKSGSKAMDGLNNFFKNLEPEYKAIKSRYPDIDTKFSAKGGRPDLSLVKQTDVDDNVFSKYASEKGSDDVFAFSTKIATDKNFILFKRYYKNGVPTNKFSMKTAVEKPGMFKAGMKELSKRMPNHKFFEETSISTDGLDMWKNQLANGYKATNELFKVPINIAGKKTKLPGISVGKGETQFGDAVFSNLDDAQVSLDIIKKKIQDIPNASVKMMKRGPVRWQLKVTLPVLESTPKSVSYWSNVPAKSLRFAKPDNETEK